jgi:hypothetical protein
MRKTKCSSCDCVIVPGVYTHAPGCPDAWKDLSRACLECGVSFKPESRHARICPDCIEDTSQEYTSRGI